jgi:hypothetical protein
MMDHATQINNCWIVVHRNLEEERAKVSKKGQNEVRRAAGTANAEEKWASTEVARD